MTAYLNRCIWRASAGGTGTWTVSSAISGFRTPAQCANPAVVTATRYLYFAESDDQQSWEDGEGVYTAGGTTLTRETIYDSSNAGAAVNFTYAPRVAMGCPLAQTGGREALTADRDYYVRTDGSDSNNGLANTAGGAFLTIQKAIDAAGALDAVIYNVTIHVADGTYTAGAFGRNLFGSGFVVLIGNTATPSNVHINVASGTAFGVYGLYTQYYLEGFKVSAGSGGDGLDSTSGSYLGASEIEFGACGAHMFANAGATIELYDNYTISGDALWHLLADTGGQIKAVGLTVSISGARTFANAFAQASSLSLVYMISMTYSVAVSVTGTRFSVSGNSVMNTNGGGASYFPGTVAGTGTNSGVTPWGLYF